MVRLFRHYIPLPSLLLAVGEAALFFLLTTMVEGADIRDAQAAGVGQRTEVSFGFAAWVAVVTVLVMSSVGMYNRQIMYSMGAVLRRAIVAIPLAGLVAYVSLLGVSLFDGAAPPSQPTIVSALLACALAGLTVHGFTNVLSADRKRRVLVLGAGPRALKVARLAEPCHFEALGFVDSGEPRANALSPVLPSSILATPQAAISFVRANGVDEILVATGRAQPLPLDALLECRLEGIAVRDFTSFFESQTGCLDLDELSANWLIFSDGFDMNYKHRIAKAVFDYCFASLLLLLTLPLTLPAALAIKLTSPGPVFFRQERVGKNGRIFQVLKFRSMRVDAEADGPKWAEANDLRVTRVGRLIRKLHIDEIPQAINVLKGEMSFIGPRPERPVFVASLALSIPYFNERHRIKPGITGWAQINYPYGASVEDARQKLSYDLYYLKNGGLFLDLVILIQTVRVVLWSEGAR